MVFLSTPTKILYYLCNPVRTDIMQKLMPAVFEQNEFDISILICQAVIDLLNAVTVISDGIVLSGNEQYRLFYHR